MVGYSGVTHTFWNATPSRWPFFVKKMVLDSVCKPAPRGLHSSTSLLQRSRFGHRNPNASLKCTLNTPQTTPRPKVNTPETPPTDPTKPLPIPQKTHMLSQKVDECKPCRHPRRPLLRRQDRRAHPCRSKSTFCHRPRGVAAKVQMKAKFESGCFIILGRRAQISDLLSICTARALPWYPYEFFSHLVAKGQGHLDGEQLRRRWK